MMMNKKFYGSILLVILFIFSGCAFKKVARSKNIIYLAADSLQNVAEQRLNIYSPHKNDALKEVLVFIYGGNWNSGKRSLYSFLGNRMARKNIVTVIIDYPKSPKANYKEMATDAAMAVKWVTQNINKYGGDADKIFVSGHSAGGHLAALIAVDDRYFKQLNIANPVKGVILIDAAGLDMYSYLKSENFPDSNTYLKTFTNDTTTWKAASPLYLLHANMPPMLIYQGGKTYPSIAAGNREFVTALNKLGNKPVYHIIKGKKHIPMITQFLNPWNAHYQEMIDFMKKNVSNATVK